MLFGCSSSGNSPEKVQETFEKEGYTIVSASGGTAVKNVSVSKGDKAEGEFVVTFRTEKKKVSSYIFNKLAPGQASEVSITYDFTNKEFNGLKNVLKDGKADYLACAYNITADKEDEMITTKGCKSTDIDAMKTYKEEAETTLADMKITEDELKAWGQWYFENN